MDINSPQKVKKPLLKQWWFWTVIVIVAIIIMANINKDKTASTLDTTSDPNTIITTIQTPMVTIKPVATPVVTQILVVTVKPTVTKEPSKPVVVQAPVVMVKPVVKDIIVYTTNTGTKYHNSGCSYLSKSKIEISLADAKSTGLTPCSKCHPPE